MLAALARREKANERDKDAEHRANERSLRGSTKAIAGLTGVLACVGVASAFFSGLQWIAINGQLSEMRKQRELTITQLQARLESQTILFQPIDAVGYNVAVGSPFAGWSFNPGWKNVGETSARNFINFSTYTYAPAEKKDGRVIWKCPDMPPIKLEEGNSVVEKDGTRVETAINVPRNIVERSFGLDPDIVLYLFGRIQYKDIFFPETPLHYFEWCVAAVPANPITGAFSFHRMYDREDEK
jgi:hypothetical protein